MPKSTITLSPTCGGQSESKSSENKKIALDATNIQGDRWKRFDGLISASSIENDTEEVKNELHTHYGFIQAP